MTDPAWLDRLETDAIALIRQAVDRYRRPALLFSGGKGCTVLAHLVIRAFSPAPPPIPLLHIDTTWEFREALGFRMMFAAANRFQLVIHHNENGRQAGLNPIEHAAQYRQAMLISPLRAAILAGGYDLVMTGSRHTNRDPGSGLPLPWSHATQADGPGMMRPDIRLEPRQADHILPILGWSEMDLWAWILSRQIALCPLYFAAPRQVCDLNGKWIMIDDPARACRLGLGRSREESVRLNALDCWPIAKAVASDARTLDGVISEIFRPARAGTAGGGATGRTRRQGSA